jgi:hypothetical protein
VERERCLVSFLPLDPYDVTRIHAVTTASQIVLGISLHAVRGIHSHITMQCSAFMVRRRVGEIHLTEEVRTFTGTRFENSDM